MEREEIRAALRPHGIELSDADLAAFKPYVDKYMAVLKGLRALELGEEEPAVSFSPLWPTGDAAS